MSKRERKRRAEAPQRSLASIPVQSVSEVQGLRWEVEMLRENATQLHAQLAQEDIGWIRLTGMGGRELSREDLRIISDLARWMYLKNPLIRRSADVQAHYVFGQGMTIHANDQLVNDVVQAFLDDAKNQVELTSQQARLSKETELQLFGNMFLVFFTNKATGRVRVRTIPVDEVDEIICNPEDAKEAWYYLRHWEQREPNNISAQRTAYYPDWHYRPKKKADIGSLNGHPVRWESPVYHLKTGCLSDMKFGVSEVYAAIDWARAYKSFLEDWATLARAYSRFAHKLTTPGGKASVAAAKSKLATTLGSGSGETNPAPLTGSTFIASSGIDLTPIRIGGANVSAEDGRRLLLMVAAATGKPETFFGDVSVGTLATARSLDRPTELQMRNRQTLWADVHKGILAYVVEQAVKAGDGELKGQVEEDDDGTPTVTLAPVEDEETGEMVERDAGVTVSFPPLLEHDVVATVSAIVQAATLGGAGVLAGTIDPKTLSRLLLAALGVEDVDAVLEVIFPPEEESAEEKTPAAEALMVEAVRELRVVLRTMVGDYQQEEA